MSESFTPSPDQPEQPEQPEPAVHEGAPKQVRRVRLVPRRRGARWAALGAAVVIVGGGLAAAAVVEHHHEQDHRGGHSAEAGSYGHGEQGQDGEQGKHGKAGEGKRHGRKGAEGAAGADGAGVQGPALAPAPLPVLPAGQAADKAAAAVTGGKVESLGVVGQQGGGSAWLAVVLGTDGVRHDVTLAGADGTVTSNTVTAHR